MRYPLFEYLENLSDISDLWFGNQEMEMFRHEHVAVHTEIELRSSLLKNSQEALFDAVIVEQWSALVATTGDEVRAADIVTALETSGHEGRVEKSHVWGGDAGHRWKCCVSVSFIRDVGAPSFCGAKGWDRKRLKIAGWRILHPTLSQKKAKDGAPTVKRDVAKNGGPPAGKEPEDCDVSLSGVEKR